MVGRNYHLRLVEGSESKKRQSVACRCVCSVIFFECLSDKKDEKRIG